LNAGDLVTLSAYGLKVADCGHAVNKVGLVVDKGKRKVNNKEVEVYFVNWAQGKKRAQHLRSDLKFVSRVKKKKD